MQTMQIGSPGGLEIIQLTVLPDPEPDGQFPDPR